MLLAVLERRARISLSGHEVYASVVGGVKLTEPGADLGMCLALVSAVSNIPLPADLVVIGEVGAHLGRDHDDQCQECSTHMESTNGRGDAGANGDRCDSGAEGAWSRTLEPLSCRGHPAPVLLSLWVSLREGAQRVTVDLAIAQEWELRNLDDIGARCSTEAVSDEGSDDVAS